MYLQYEYFYWHYFEVVLRVTIMKDILIFRTPSLRKEIFCGPVTFFPDLVIPINNETSLNE